MNPVTFRYANEVLELMCSHASCIGVGGYMLRVPGEHVALEFDSAPMLPIDVGVKADAIDLTNTVALAKNVPVAL